MPSVFVSTPLMKKRATDALNGAISAATCGVLRFSDSTMRSSMSMRYASIDSSKPLKRTTVPSE
jgi:hypothetical protein